MKTDLLSNYSSDLYYCILSSSLKFLQCILNSLNRFRYATAGFLGCLKYCQGEIIHIRPNPGSNLTGTLSQTEKTREDVVLPGTTGFSWGNCNEKLNGFFKIAQKNSEKAE